MQPQYKIESLSISDLKLDQNNPRFEKTNSQKDAINTMFEKMGQKIVPLAKHIAENGLNPSQRPIIFKENNQLVDGDSNRRLSVLKAMKTPNLINDEKLRNQIKEIDASNIPSVVECVVFKNRDDAKIWIGLNHNGQGKGEGVIPWTPESKGRFNNMESIGTQFLNKYVEQENTEFYHKSTMDRVFGNGFIKKELGITLENEKVNVSKINEEKAKYLVSALKNVKVKEVYDTGLIRKFYKENISAELLTPSSNKPDFVHKLSSSAELLTPSSKKEKPTTQSRTSVAPMSLKLNIDNQRSINIFKELKEINVFTFPNASAVLLRVFLELSVNFYISKNSVQCKGDQLNSRFEEAVNHMQLEKNEKKALQKVISDVNKPTHTSLLNIYVHNSHYNPRPYDIKISFDDFILFFQKVYPL